MLETSPFNVYNASAGSGKTFTLVKEYLKILFRSKNISVFRKILALTFTNKAVGEMKARIIDKLILFSDRSILTSNDDTFDAICKDLSISPKMLHDNSKRILNTILHNYASFDISTIDKFTHRVIRTFAFDLKIPINFEVELDTDTLLAEAVDSLIAKAGIDKALTKVLIAFAIEKADDDKSWDISFDFNKIAKFLVNENDIPFLELLKDKSLKDFNNLKSILKSKIASTEKAIVKKANEALHLIEECGLEHNDFSGRNGYVPSYFLKLASKETNISYDKVWMTNIETHPLYPKTTESSIASILDEIQAQIAAIFYETKQLVIQQKFQKNFYKNITPLSVLNAINLELKDIKSDKNLLLISEFNKTIYNEVKDQPTPFIYERLGEKFNHFFIDEFQDTSELQWENLIPLLGNSLSAETGSTMIVGDAKQAIYRWRGGRPELFISLFNEANPFQVEKTIHNLPTNYRSCNSIVGFNNAFFEHISSFVFNDETHAQLYKTATQKHYLKEEGYVNLNFLEFNAEDDRDIKYPEAVLQTVKEALLNGFKLRDICILVRKKKEGVAVADYLSANGIAIISSDTLLINRSTEVIFITNLLSLSMQPENYELKVDVLYHIANLLHLDDKHDFIVTHLQLDLNELTQAFRKNDIAFSFNNLSQYTLYQAAEYIIKAFNLVKTSDAYIQFYLDVVLEYMQKHSSSILNFLSYWEKKKRTLSITIPDGQDAVQIMTIHKSKGLEFPIVIFPYADLNIYQEREPKIWFPIEGESFNNFSQTLLNYNKDIADYGTQGKAIYDQHQSELELDNINLLYVTLTRPIEQLYIISKMDLDAKGNEKLKEYSGLFINYLKQIGKWADAKNNYSFGSIKKQLEYKDDQKTTIHHECFVSTSDSNAVKIVTNSGYLWDTTQEKALEKGNLIHLLMSKIETLKDVDFVLNDAFMEGVIDREQLDSLSIIVKEIVNHSQLKAYFNEALKIYNERDIISSNGQILRPDRLVVNKSNDATIIDYKTGKFNPQHAEQLQSYQDIIETMDIKVVKKILIYVNEQIIIKEV